MIKKFLSLIAAFALTSLVAFAADVWRIYTITDKSDVNLTPTTNEEMLTVGDKVTFVVELINPGSQYAGGSEGAKGTEWGYIREATSTSTVDIGYPTIALDIGGRRAEADIVGIKSAYNGYATALICEYTVKSGDLARPLKFFSTKDANWIISPSPSGITIGIGNDTPNLSDGMVGIAPGEMPIDYNDWRQNATLSRSNVRIEAVRFGEAAPYPGSDEDVWLSVHEGSSDLYSGEAVVELPGSMINADPVLYIWSGDESVVKLVAGNGVLVPAGKAKTYTKDGETWTSKESSAYKLIFTQGVCRFKLDTSVGGKQGDSALIYVAPTPGMDLITTPVDNYITAKVNVIEPTTPKVRVRLDGAAEREVVPGLSSNPKMVIRLEGRPATETVTVTLGVSFKNREGEDVTNPAAEELLIVSDDERIGTLTQKTAKYEYAFAPGEIEKEVYYYLKGAPSSEKGNNVISINPTCTDLKYECHGANMIVTPQPYIESVTATGFQSGKEGEVIIKVKDTVHNLGLSAEDTISVNGSYKVEWFLNTNDDVAAKTEEKVFSSKGSFKLSGITYSLAGDYLSRVVVTTPDNLTIEKEVAVSVKERTYAKLVRLDGAEFIKPIGEDGNTTMFKIVLEPNPGHSGALYAFFKATENADLIDDAGLPYAAAGHNGLLITSGETEPFAIKFKDNGINTPTGEPVIETVLRESGVYLAEEKDYTNYGVTSTRLVVDNTPAYISQFRIKPNGKTPGTAQAKTVTDATKAYDYEATYTSAIRVVADDKESMELSAYIADVVNDRESDVLVEWRVLDADGDQARIYYTYSTPEKGWVKCPYAPEFNFAGAHFVEVRALDKDQVAAYRATSDELDEFLNPDNFDDGVSLTVLEAEDYPFFGNFEGTIPSSRIGFTVSENPGMTVSLDKSASASEDGTYMGWYESNEIHTVNITLDSKVTGVATMEFDVVITPVDETVTATAKDFSIVGSDVFNKTTVKIGNGKNSTSFQLIAKDGGSSAKYKITVAQKAGYTSTFQNGECSFAIYNKAPILLVQQGIDTMSAVQAANDLEAEIVATAGIPYTITWVIDDVASDEIDVRWSNSNNPGNTTDLDLPNKTWTTTFLSPTKPDGALHRVTVSWKDDDETIYHSFSWNVRVDASKTVTLYPMGPTKGANNEGLNNLYNTIAGKGKGKVFIEGYENNAAFETSHKWKVGNVGEVTIKAEATKADPILGGFDSFFYTWLQVTREEGAAGYTITRAGAPLPDVTGETSIPLPEQTNEDGTYTDTVFEAVFSKEFKPEDNCGDINQDGIPDIFVAKYKFGLFNNGKLEGDDLADLTAFNEDEDYLPIPNELNAIGVIGTTNSWIDTARAFTAKSEIRGYFEGLNLVNATVVEDTESITSDKTFYDAKKSDLEHWAYMQAVEAALGAEEWTTSTNSWVEGGQDLSVYKNADVCLDWTPENPTDPTKADTDGDGLPDGYEYAIWYRAHVGYIVIKDGDRIPHKAEGSRYRLNPETKLPESQKITWQEIEERFNPTVALPEVDSYLSDFDNDGLSDWMEYQVGTNPYNWDTDGDGVPDGWEVSKGMNPLNAADGNAEVSNPDGDVMAAAKAYLLNFELDDASYWWVVPNLMGGFGDPNSVSALVTKYEFVEKRDDDGNIVYEEDGVTPVKTLLTTYEIPAGTEIIGAVLNTTTAPKVVDIPGTSRLLAVRAEALKSQKLYFPEGATIISYSTEPYSIIHDQVYNFYGFDPRVAWYTGNAKGLLGERWEGINGANKLGLSNYGVPTSTSSAFTTLNEYGYAFYCIHTKGAGVTDAAHPFQKDTNLINLATDPTKADSDNDGMPDGWELYVGLNPLSPAKNPDYNLDPDNDGLTNAQEFFANDSCAAYAGVETIAGKADPKWLNKHWPTDPNDKDTDGDGILDGAEGGTFAYAAEPQDGKKIIYRGGGLNPNSVDTDLDGLPDAWEAQFAGTAIQVVGDTFNTVGNETALDQDTKKLIYPVESQIADGLRGDFTMTRASGSAMAEGTRYVVRGMDGTYEGDVATTYDPLSGLPDSADPATGTIRDFDFDHDGLENYQEYLTQAIRGFRYDDTETPLMGRSIIWKGDTNKGNYVEFEDGKPVSNMPKVDITDVFNNLESLEIDESLIFPTFNYTDSAKFLQSMKKKVDVIDPDTLEKVGERYENGPLLEHMMVQDNKFMNLVVPGEKRRLLVGTYVDEDSDVTYFGVIIDGQTVKVEDMVNNPDYAEEFTVTWPENDHAQRPIVERTGKNTDNITLPGVANVGYDYAKLGYFAYPKQSWDMAVMTTVHGNSQMSPRSKYMLPPTSMTHYYTTLSATIMDGEEDGTTNGYGSKREFASGYVSTSPRDADTDNDGMDDYYELFHGLNPLYGNLDVIGSKYGFTIKADKNLWTYIHEGTEDEIDRGKLFDPIKYPWAIGHQDCDADGDGLRNFDEAICANMASPTTYHTDPTPRWMTDPHGLLSYVRQFYGFDPTLSSMSWNLVDAQADRYTGGLAKPRGWIASFEQTEGYDTDGDFVSDSSEVVKSTMPSSDPQNPADPARRQAMYFPGENSAMMTRSDVVVNAWDSLEIFHTFTVECWLKPDSDNIGEEQVVFERAHWYDAAKKGDTGHYRANFRIGIDAEGQVYGLFDNDISETSGEDIVTTSQLITGPKLAIGDWTHVAMTFDGKALKLFINGELSKTVRASNDGSQTLIPANGVTAIIKNPTSDNYPLGAAVEMSGAFVLGATMTDLWHESKNIANLDKFYKGFVDEVRVWDGARTDVEIAGGYNVRYGKNDIAALRDNVYVSWCDGATRNDNDGKPVLPAELKCNWSFDQMPAALKSEDVAVTPAGFIKNVIDPVEWETNAGFNRRFFNVAWYVNEFADALSTVYCNDYVNEGTYIAMTVPSAKNIAQQLPDYAGMLPDSHYWSQYISGMKPASDNSVESYTIPNTMNPYTDAIILGTRVLPYWRLIRFANITQNEVLQELARKHRFHSRSMFSSTTDLYPLGGAYAKLAPEMWDNQGPTDAWVDTLKNDAGLLAPEWWVTMKGGAHGEYYTTTAPAKIIEDYLRDIAAGMQPNGEIDPEYAAKSDVNTNGIPDWWEALYGLDGKTYDTDKDGLPDYIEYYVSEVLAKNLKLDGFRLDPTNKMSDGLTLDYFLKLGDLYLGEVFTDHDQMDDVWENKYDMSKISRYVYDPNNDLDMDGWSNYAEFRSNTDPTLYGARGLEDVQLSEYPIPAIALHLESEDELNSGSSFVIAAKRSSLPAEEDNGSYDAKWFIGAANGENKKVNFSNTNEQPAEGDYSRLMGKYVEGVKTYHISPGSISAGSVKIYAYDPSFYVNYSRTGLNTHYVDTIAWAPFIHDISVSSSEGYLRYSNTNIKVGTINYTTGTLTIDFRLLPEVLTLDYNLVTGQKYDKNEQGTILGYYTSYVSLRGDVQFGIEWRALPIYGGRYNTYYLSEADEGHIREGKNDFIAFLDEDGDGKYTIGEPFGAVNGVDVGWDSAKLSIKLTKTNPLFPRFSIMSGENDRDYWYGVVAKPTTGQSTTTTEDGTEITYTPDASALNGRLVRVRVIRHSTNIGELAKDKQVAVFDKYLNIDKRDYIHEGDILKAGQFDLDWDAAKDIFTGTTDYGEVRYNVVLGENGEYTNATQIVRYYDTKAADGRKTATNLKDVHCYNARPTFSWMMRPARDSNIEFNTYTAFKIQIKDKANAVIYDSGCQPMPPADQEGYRNWTAPISFGDIVRGKLKYSILPYSGEFTWNIWIYNSKFQDDNNSYCASGKLSASIESEGKFVEGHGYGALDVTIKYAGPAMLLDKVLPSADDFDGSLPEGQVRVEAFETPDFSGDAVASAFVKKVDGELKTMVCGLEIGKAYYLRAYLDSDGDQKKSDWESWGCTTAPTTVTPVPNTVSFYIEDCDTDHDWLPDAWEYAKAGNLTKLGGNNEKKLIAAEGLWSLQLQGSMSLDKATQQKLLVAPSADTFVTESFASLLLGAPIDISDDGAIRGQIEDDSLVITGFKVENGKVKIELDATVSSVLNTALAKLYKVEDNLKVKVEVLHADSLDGAWTAIGSKSDVTFGKEAQSIEIDLEETTPANGFYKVTIAQ